MDKNEMMILLRPGRSAEWNNYRERNPDWIPDFAGMDLSGIVLAPKSKEPFDLSRANLCGCKLSSNHYYDLENTAGSRVIVKGALIDVDTKYPASFDIINNGAVYVSKSEQKSREPQNPRIFVSYAWANEDVVLAIDAWLRSKNLLTKIDKRDFFAGSRIRDEIVRVMTDCDIILIFYSKKSEGKPWPQFERELASDIEMAAKQKGNIPPRIIYIVIDDTPLPSVSEINRIAIKAKGKRFELVCEEIYHNILQLPKPTEEVELMKWRDYIF